MSGEQNLAFDPSETGIGDGQQLSHRRSKTDDSEQMDMTNYTIEPAKTEETPNIYRHRSLIITAIIHVTVITYFVFATLQFFKSTGDDCIEDCVLAFCTPYGMLIFVTGVAYLGLLHFQVIKPYFGESLKRWLFEPIGYGIKQVLTRWWSKVIIVVIFILGMAGYILFETYTDFTRLRSLVGIFSIILFGFVFSANPKKIKWRPVVCGAIFQFLLGVFCIRSSVGRSVFECFGQKVVSFLDYGKEGASFVFGDFLVIEKGIFAFAVLPIIFFFSLFISVLYYLGAMQWVLFKLGWILQSILGTTVCESVNAAGNIFLGMTEGPLIIKPYIKLLTESEMHAIMVSGFATVSGTVLAAYVSFGAEPQHLITASVMAAPASLFFSKLIMPETEKSLTSMGNIQMEKSTDSSVLDAASNGASTGTSLILNIIANLVAFVAVIAFADGMLLWLTTLLGFDGIGIEWILGKMFMPISWALGVDWEDCEEVGNVIGTKTIINEFVAYQRLGEYKRNGDISLRSSAIATYAICGFANPSSMGISIGALSALAPDRRPSITKVAFRAFVSGCLVSLITASIAGLLMTDEMVQGTAPKNMNLIRI